MTDPRCDKSSSPSSCGDDRTSIFPASQSEPSAAPVNVVISRGIVGDHSWPCPGARHHTLDHRVRGCGGVRSVTVEPLLVGRDETMDLLGRQMNFSARSPSFCQVSAMQTADVRRDSRHIHHALVSDKQQHQKAVFRLRSTAQTRFISLFLFQTVKWSYQAGPPCWIIKHMAFWLAPHLAIHLASNNISVRDHKRNTYLWEKRRGKKQLLWVGTQIPNALSMSFLLETE